jgi:hypothetical protein
LFILAKSHLIKGAVMLSEAKRLYFSGGSSGI